MAIHLHLLRSSEKNWGLYVGSLVGELTLMVSPLIIPPKFFYVQRKNPSEALVVTFINSEKSDRTRKYLMK